YSCKVLHRPPASTAIVTQLVTHPASKCSDHQGRILKRCSSPPVPVHLLEHPGSHFCQVWPTVSGTCPRRCPPDECWRRLGSHKHHASRDVADPRRGRPGRQVRNYPRRIRRSVSPGPCSGKS